MAESAESPPILILLTPRKMPFPRWIWPWLLLMLALLACRAGPEAPAVVTPSIVASTPSRTPGSTATPAVSRTPRPTLLPTLAPTAMPEQRLIPYHSDELGLSFDYPAAWHLSPAPTGYIWLTNVITAAASLPDPQALLLFITPLDLPDVAPEALLAASAETLGLDRFSPGLDLIETLQPPTAQPHPGGLAATAIYLSRYQGRPVTAQLTAVQQAERAALVIWLAAPEVIAGDAAVNALIQSLHLRQPTLIPHMLGGLLPESNIDAILHADEIHEHILAAPAGSDLIVAVTPQGYLELDLIILSPQGDSLIRSVAMGKGVVNAVRFQPTVDGEYVVRIVSRSRREGRYSLSANKVYRQSTASLLPGKQLELTLDGASSRAIIIATATQAVAPFAAQLTAIDSNGVALTGLDVTLSADPISRLIPLRLGRTYNVRLTNRSATTQAVSLVLALTPVTQIDLGAGSEIISHLTFVGATPVVLPVSAMTAARFAVAIAPEGALVVTGELLAADGARLAAFNSAQAQVQSFNLPQAGEYRLVLRGQGAEAGQATLNRYLPTLLAGALMTGDQVFGWLSSGEALTFLIEGQPGQGQNLTLLDADMGIDGEWLDAADVPLLSSSIPLTIGQSVLITPSEARLYHLRLRARDQSDGSFSLLFSDAKAPNAPTPPAAMSPALLRAR